MPFGQVVIGPPAAGKSTYCFGVQQFFSQIDRPLAIVNLDPANDNIDYEYKINICDFIDVSSIMEDESLGPNGALLFAFDWLQLNFDWFLAQLLTFKDHYFVFDLPGQIELFTMHPSLRSVLHSLTKHDFRLVCVNLIDSLTCLDPGKFISAVLISLVEMLHLELPHVNILSKHDLLTSYEQLPADLSLFLEAMDLSSLVGYLEKSEQPRKFQHLNLLLAQLLDDFSLVRFMPLAINDKDMMIEVQEKCDQAICYPWPFM
ncbi:hypothetical protein GEMRC1_010746 [Eukaryota sp. GEM-RC1]